MNKDQEKLVKAVGRRLREAEKFWDQACSEYQDFEEFLSSLNALIQALRNITFILQSNKSLISDFDAWYLNQQDLMRGSDLLRWLISARNTIVKQEDLKMKSIAKVSLMNWEDQPLYEFDIDPLTKSEDVILAIPSERVSFFVKKLREPVLKLDRCWIVDSLPEYEVLNALAECYFLLRELIGKAYEQAGIDKVKIDELLECEKRGFLVAKKVPDKNKIAYFDLKNGDAMGFSVERIEKDSDLDKKVEERYGISDLELEEKGPAGLTDPFVFVEKHLPLSKKMLVVDGHHVPMVHLFFKDAHPRMILIPFEDKTQLYLLMRMLADIALRDHVTGMVFILETWIGGPEFTGQKGFPVDDPEKKEAMCITAIDSSGRYELHMQLFHRGEDEEIILDDCQIENDLSQAFWLHPVTEVWGFSF